MKDATKDEEAQAETASSMLLSAREAMGLSQDDVAKELYLTSSFIRYIDENDLNKLPRAFVRGYLRSYAKLVKIDGDAVVRQYETTSNAVSPESIEIRRVTNQPVGSVNFTGPVFKTGVIGLSALLLVVLLVWWFSSSDEAPEITVSEYNPVEVIPEVVPFQLPQRTVPDSAVSLRSEAAGTNQAGDISEPLPAVPVRSADPETINPETFDPETMDLEAIDTEAGVRDSGVLDSGFDAALFDVPGKPISVQREVVGLISHINVDAGGEDELRFVFSDDCWLEIEDGEGFDIYGDLGRAGDELTVLGLAPFDILLGRAPVVRLEYNGNPVDLGVRTSSDDTAKVRVGG